ncbi:hypothetical protein [Streptomyces sp. RKAG293]|uniref:hypothetical protein n=1 Tax=Streptomyces sp. RKAG293 TaxID=2893403 RepID=UPI002033977C|nr:hypothetical protein [Streptomyces sp. RKAG293]MCM2423782.1 hypothetical protein [Streptomyces sp. RKAG293]
MPLYIAVATFEANGPLGTVQIADHPEEAPDAQSYANTKRDEILAMDEHPEVDPSQWSDLRLVRIDVWPDGVDIAAVPPDFVLSVE